MVANGQKFKQQQIVLDGGSFYNCTFEECDLIYSGLMPVFMNGNTLKDCRWRFDGPAVNTMAFLTMLHNSGARELVEATFEGVRNGSLLNPNPGQPAPAPTAAKPSK
ncbi:MAG TPA: hypothetical protein VKA19_10480 [Alphaproteobacteria bacterium]|nr:hypothetical protein [Alphaproteobacteria bacterium]